MDWTLRTLYTKYDRNTHVVFFARAVEAEVRKQDDALIQQLVEALEYHRSQTRPIHQTNEAITAARARLQHLLEEKSKEQ